MNAQHIGYYYSPVQVHSPDRKGTLHHHMSERLAAYYRRGYLIRDRVKALGLSK